MVQVIQWNKSEAQVWKQTTGLCFIRLLMNSLSEYSGESSHCGHRIRPFFFFFLIYIYLQSSSFIKADSWLCLPWELLQVREHMEMFPVIERKSFQIQLGWLLKNNQPLTEMELQASKDLPNTKAGSTNGWTQVQKLCSCWQLKNQTCLPACLELAIASGSPKHHGEGRPASPQKKPSKQLHILVYAVPGSKYSNEQPQPGQNGSGACKHVPDQRTAAPWSMPTLTPLPSVALASCLQDICTLEEAGLPNWVAGEKPGLRMEHSGESTSGKVLQRWGRERKKDELMAGKEWLRIKALFSEHLNNARVFAGIRWRENAITYQPEQSQALVAGLVWETVLSLCMLIGLE